MLLQYLTIKTTVNTKLLFKNQDSSVTLVVLQPKKKLKNSYKNQKQNWNATHNCSAYLIGEQDQIQKANDDGEPSGTAGVPMLEVLKTRFKRYRRCRYPIFWWHQTGSWWINSRIWKMYKRRH